MPNEPLSTQNYVQIGDKVLNRTADASVTTNDVSLSDRVFVFKKNEDGSIKTVVNTTIQYIVDAFSADATAIKNSTKEYCDGIKADTSQLKADTLSIKNSAISEITTIKNNAISDTTALKNTTKTYRDEAQSFRDEVNLTLIKQTILDTIYPIGSIYMSTNSTDPGSFLGGSWAPIKDRFLLAAGDKYAAGSEDGLAMHSHTTAVHTLTVDEMPSHTHMLNINSDNSEPFLPNGNINTLSVINNMGAFSKNGVICDRNPVVISARTINTYTGGSASHSHGITGASSSMPPYLTVYVWKRIPPQN